MSHIVKSCPLTKLNGGLSRLHSADEDAVSWLTSYGSWHAYEKKKKYRRGMNEGGKEFDSHFQIPHMTSLGNSIFWLSVMEFTSQHWQFAHCSSQSCSACCCFLLVEPSTAINTYWFNIFPMQCFANKNLSSCSLLQDVPILWVSWAFSRDFSNLLSNQQAN